MDPQHTPDRAANWCGRLNRTALMLVLLLISIFYIDWRAVTAQFDIAHLKAFVFVQPFQLFALFLVSVRFLLLCGGGLHNLRNILVGYILSVGLNTFIPGRLSEIIKISYPMRSGRLKAAKLTAAVILEKYMDAMFLGLFLALGFGATWIFIDHTLVYAVLFACIVATVLLPNVVLRFGLQNSKIRLFQLGYDVLERIASVVTSLTLLYAAIITASSWLVSCGCIALILYILFPYAMTMETSLLVFSAMALGRAIPGLPGSIGTFEAAIVFVLTSKGYTFSESMAAALLIHASQISIVTLLALLIFATEGLGLKHMLASLRQR